MDFIWLAMLVVVLFVVISILAYKQKMQRIDFEERLYRMRHRILKEDQKEETDDERHTTPDK